MRAVPSDLVGLRSSIAHRAMLALCVIVMVVVTACASSDDEVGSASTSSDGDGTRTTVEFQGSTDELCDTQEQCAESLYWAWIAGDRTRADGIATEDAVSSLFATTYQPIDDWQYNGCSGAAGSTGCQWTDHTGRTLTMMISNGGADATPPPPPPPYEVRSATIS